MGKPPDKRTQRQKFIDTAREVGAEDDEKAFADKLRKIAKGAVKDRESDKS